MDRGNREWNADRLAQWIRDISMPTSSQSLSRPTTVGTVTSNSVFLLPEGEVSFIALNKSRPRPTRPRKEVDKLSVFLQRVAAERGPDMANFTTKNRQRVSDVISDVLQAAFSLDPRFMQAFDMPQLSLSEDDMLETLGPTEFNCRLFLKKFEHPDTIQITSGVQDDVPPGVALCRLSDKLTPPEQMRARHQMALVMDELGYVSPSRVYPWFAQGIATAVQMVVQKRRNIFRNKEEENVQVNLQFPKVVLEVSTSDEVLIVNLFPAIRGMGWPRGAILQHGLPKQRRFAESGHNCVEDIIQRIDDGQTLWYMDAIPVRLDPSLQKKARFRGGLRKIYGGIDRFWKINLSPARHIVLNNVVATCAHHEYTIHVADIRNVILSIASEHVWSAVTPSLVDTAIMWSVKRSLAQTRNLGQCFQEVVSFLQRTLISASCPDFLMPNVNVADGLNTESTQAIVQELTMLIEDVKKSPSSLLQYIGYRSNSRATNQTRKSRAASYRNVISRQSSHCTIYSKESSAK